MTSRFLPAVRAILRAWTRLYTWGLPPHVAEARRAEIESDLWEFEADDAARGGLNPAVHTLARWLMGIPDDLLWRIRDAAADRKSSRRAAIVTVLATLLAAVWLITSLERTEVPRIAAAPLQWRRPVPAPPPPPPPPPPPLVVEGTRNLPVGRITSRDVFVKQ